MSKHTMLFWMHFTVKFGAGTAFVYVPECPTSRSLAIRNPIGRPSSRGIKLPVQRRCRRNWSLDMCENDENSTSVESVELPSWNFVSILLGATLVAGSTLAHAEGWGHLYRGMSEMRSISSPSEFSSALQFWLFGALSHPLLKPIFGVSEILHASPGPRLAGLVPVSFAAASAVVAWILAEFQFARNAAWAVAVALLVNSVGVGLEGRDPSLLGDYNIQIDDDYRGEVVRGCPAPDGDALSRNLPASAFDYQRYQGRWYWHKVHDWTQFQEMYDTSLDIRLTDTGYVNTLTMKGPSPSKSPLSWDKSPLMNGVKYSWVGTVDKASPPGTSMESGFGVVFPNYIVDVKADEDGNYDELIQFQCIEVGGVRLYEGIDFMSRNPETNEEQLRAMHRRANAAGLDPYGSSPEQMHRVEHIDQSGAASRDTNEWQRLWKRLDIERYLDQSLK